MPFIGVSPQFGVRKKHTYTATAGQTSFSGAGSEGATLSYTDSNFVDVYQNGVKLGDADYTSTSGTAIVLAQGASVDDLVEIIVFDAFSAADTVSKADGGTFDGAVTFGGGVSGVLDADGGITVDNITIDGTEIDLSSGNLTIDVAGQLIINSDSGQIVLQDDTANWGNLQNSSGDFIIGSLGADKDIKIQGLDSSSTIDALTLDMSDAGAATFNAGVTATTGTFDLDVDSNGRWSVEKFKGLLFQIERDANSIAQRTRRGKGNMILCSADVASALTMAGVLDYTPALNANLQVDDTGNTFAGVLQGKYRVYIDPYSANSAVKQYYVVGYKGTSPYDAGLFYCPYVPLQMVRAVGQDTFQPKIGFKTRYGMVANPFAEGTDQGFGRIKANSNRYYQRVTVTNLM